MLSAQKQQLLKEHGYPADYLDPVYDCPDCQDTGYLPDHSKCHCMKQKIAHYLYEQSGLENLLETENFSHLSTDYYQGEDLTRFKKTVQNARKFVSDFSSHYRNLLFYGTVGTGKSFYPVVLQKNYWMQAIVFSISVPVHYLIEFPNTPSVLKTGKISPSSIRICTHVIF